MEKMPCQGCRSGSNEDRSRFQYKPPEKLIEGIVGCKSFSICNQVLSSALPHELRIDGVCHQQIETALELFLESVLTASVDRILEAERAACDWFLSRALFEMLPPQSRYVYRHDSIYAFKIFFGNVRSTIGFSPVSTVIIPCWRYDLALNEIQISSPQVTELPEVRGECEWT
jgi:hypothetical protein